MAAPDDRDRRGKDEEGLSSLALAYRKAAPLMAASTQLVASVGVLAGLGWWADQKLEHKVPWLLLLGAGLGMAGGFISFFRIVLDKKNK